MLPDFSPGVGVPDPGLCSLTTNAQGRPPQPPPPLLCPQGAYAYVLHDNSFPFLTQMASGPQCLEDAPEEWGALGLRPDLISPTYLALTPGRPLPEPSEALSQVSASPSSHNE